MSVRTLPRQDGRSSRRGRRTGEAVGVGQGRARLETADGRERRDHEKVVDGGEVDCGRRRAEGDQALGAQTSVDAREGGSPCPCHVSEVCFLRSAGKALNEMSCSTSENVAEIMVCEAMIWWGKAGREQSEIRHGTTRSGER